MMICSMKAWPGDATFVRIMSARNADALHVTATLTRPHVVNGAKREDVSFDAHCFGHSFAKLRASSLHHSVVELG